MPARRQAPYCETLRHRRLARLHRGQLLDVAVPSGELRVALAPAVVRKAEIEIAQHAADRDLADRARAREVFAPDRGKPLMRLFHLPVGPAGPAFVFRPGGLVTAQD